MSRPATAGGAVDTASSSFSSGGVWRTGSSSIGSRIGNDTTDSMDVRRQVMCRPMTGNGPPQGRGVESISINGIRPNNAREGTSLISVLEGNDTGNRNIVGPQGNRYRSDEQQIQGRGQGPSPGQEQVQGQGYRPPFNTPSGVGTGQVQGRTPGFTPQTPNPPSSPLGIQRYANGSSSDRPLTPSTLFLPSSNSQQSQYFQRQQQQLQQQQQQGRQQQQPYQVRTYI